MSNKVIYLAGGCFWGMEKYFQKMKGVVGTRVGYANGNTDAPTYEQVKYENTGHAETVKVEYDPEVIGLEFILHMYYQVIDPVSVNKQGEDVGVQYRTGIYYTDSEDEGKIRKSLENLQKEYDQPLAVECEPLRRFDDAEEYHQEYLKKNPGGYCHIGASAFSMAEEAEPETDKE